MMFNHFLKNGKANDEWVELLMILQKIIESVQPISSKAEMEELGLTNHDIIEATRNKLAHCKKGKKVVDAVMLDLEATYESIMSSTDIVDDLDAPQVDEALVDKKSSDRELPEDAETETEAESDEELELDQEEAQAEAEPEPEIDPEIIAKEKIAKLPEGVSPGAWFIVYNGEDKPVRRLKLAVILVHDASMVFVDHLGNVVIEKEADVFADEIEKGLSGIIMQHSVFDHALHSALETIDR